MARFALAQLESRERKEDAMDHALKLLKNASAAGATILCFPEQWYPSPIENFDKDMKELIDISRDEGICVITGAVIETIDGIRYISSPVINKGEIIGRQFKIHPYREEKKRVKAGKKLEIFETEFKFGIAICHDVVFPEVSRMLTRKGADAIFFPSKIRSEGIEPWQIYVKARALENRIAAIAPNVCSEIFGGRSISVDIDFNEAVSIAIPSIAEASASEQILVVDIDLDKLRRIRKMRFEEFRDNAYENL